jgi:hypothetical protein
MENQTPKKQDHPPTGDKNQQGRRNWKKNKNKRR